MDPLNFFGAAQSMMNRLQSQILGALQTIFPLNIMMNLVFFLIAGIFLFHLVEAFTDAGKSGTVGDAFNIFKDLIRKKFLRIVIYTMLAIGAVLLTNNGLSLLNDAQNNHGWSYVDSSGLNPDNTDMSRDFGYWLISWMGSNQLQDVIVTNADGSTTTLQQVKMEAPPIQALLNATSSATKAIDGLSAVQIYDQVDDEIQQHLGMNGWDVGVGNLIDLETMMSTAVLRHMVDGFLYVTNRLAFLWAQWTLCRTLVVQALFMQMSWHLGLYFMPLFILLAYFRSTHGFLVNLVINYAAMMIASYVMASIALVIFQPATWIGTSSGGGAYTGGVIQAAFSNVTLTANSNASQFTSGSFPWITTTFARQVARGQIIWLLGAVGLILGHVYEMVRGVLSGSFRSYFNPGSADSGSLFGGK